MYFGNHQATKTTIHAVANAEGLLRVTDGLLGRLASVLEERYSGSGTICLCLILGAVVFHEILNGSLFIILSFCKP